MTNRPRIGKAFGLFFTLMPLVAPAGDIDVRGGQFPRQGEQVVEDKCLSCHNRQRIEQALREGKDMNTIMFRMEKKGVTLTDKERKTMGVYWEQQQLFKNKGTTGQPR